MEQYRNALQVLNLRAADDDPSCTKAFDCSQEGEVLGICFNTIDFMWSLPHGKLVTLVTDLRKIANGDKVQYSLRELERILRKLNHISQLCPPLKTFTSEATFLMVEHIRKLSDAQVVCQDLLLVATLIADTYDHPLPIVDPEPPVPLSATLVYTDASGHIAAPTSPSLGILFPPEDMLQAGAHSLPFPANFLLQSNGTGLVADTSSTLEALGIHIPLMIDPFSGALV